jgi:Tfp pilus assembly protein PilO
MQDQDQKLSELETENRKMKLELEEYRAEAAHLKNQQATIRRLEERNRQLEQQVCSVAIQLALFSCFRVFFGLGDQF